MPSHDIKTRFVLEGEKEYQRSMTDAANAIKVLNSEQRLAQAEFEATGDSEQYAAEQARILKEQINKQQKAVEAAEAAVKKLTENGVDKNSTQMQKWQTKLNNAKTSLTKMETQLNKVETELGEEGTAFEGAQTAANNYQEDIEKVNRGIDFQNTIAAIDNITDHIEKIIKAAARAAKAVWETGVDAGQWADNIATAASQLGVDPETYQSWQYASRFIDTSVEDIQRSWQDIQKKLDETNTDYLGNLARMGIASRESAGNLRESSDIFWDSINYLHGIADASTRAQKANELFGNDWRRLNPLIEAGADAYKQLAEEGKSIAVVSNENVAALGSVDDAVQDFGARFDKLKYDTLAALAPTFEQVAKALGEAVTALDEFVQSEEGQAALSSLNEALTGIIESFTGDSGNGTFESLVEAAKGAVSDLTGALDWFSEHGDAVTAVVAGLGGAWATLKVTKEVLTFMQLLKQVDLSKLQSIFGGGKASAEGMDSKFSGAAKNAANKSASEVAAKAASDSAVKSTESSSAAAQSAAKASADSSAASSAAAQESGTASSQAAIESGAASSQAAVESGAASSASAEAASQAAIASAEASKIAAQSASANLLSGSVPNIGVKPSLKLPIPQNNYDPNNPLRLGSGENNSGLKVTVPAGMAKAFSALPEMLKGVSFVSTLLALTLKPTKTGNNDIWDENGNVTAEGRAAGITWNQQQDSQEKQQELVDAWQQARAEEQKAKALAEEAKAIAQMDAAQNYWDAYRNPESTDQEIIEKSNALREAFAGDLAGFSELQDRINEFIASGTWTTLEELPADLPAEWFTDGQNAAAGLANGINKSAGVAISAARNLAIDVRNIVSSALRIASPSKVFEGMGAYVSEGFALGIESGVADVRSAAAMMAAATMQPVAGAGFNAGYGLQGAQNYNTGSGANGQPMFNATIVMDKRVVGEMIAPVVNTTIGAVVSAERG